jgi:hypothetical protein
MMAGQSGNEEPLPPSFVYEALPLTPALRLLNLRPESENGTMALETYTLDSAPPFAALSYTWGCPFSYPNYELENAAETPIFNRRYTADRDNPTLCNSGIIYVTRNAIEAIANIKTAFIEPGNTFDGTTYLWVDAICINQEDLDERAEQVKIMASIYAAATRVFIWLGSPLAKTDRVLYLIMLLSQIPNEKFEQMKQHYMHDEGAYPPLGMETISIADWLAVRSFLDRNWFRRVWTVQEWSIPKITSICVGQYSIPWLELSRVPRQSQEK